MATIRDIAKLTGYSITTISRVINHHPYVDEEKRKKVLAVMAELNYIPNKTAQNLSFGKTRNVGVILPFVDHPFYSQLTSGIMNAAFEHQYKLTLLPTNYDQKLELGYLEDFAAKSFDGLIVTTRANHLTVFKPYLKNGPIIFCEATPDPKIPYVAIDLKDSLKASLTHLKIQGVKKLGLTLGRSKRISGNSIMTMEISRQVFPDFCEQDIFWDCFSAADGWPAADFFKARQVDGIITNGDEVAATILQSYQGQRPPVIIGRENLLISQLLQFSTLDHHLEHCGAEAFRLFHEHSLEQITVPYELIIR